MTTDTKTKLGKWFSILRWAGPLLLGGAAVIFSLGAATAKGDLEARVAMIETKQAEYGEICEKILENQNEMKTKLAVISRDVEWLKRREDKP